MPRLDIAKVLYGAFALPWVQREEFTRTLALPLALLFTLTMAWFEFGDSLPNGSQWLLLPLYGAMFTLLAVPCHRLVLIGPGKDAPIPSWEGRKTYFLLWMGLLWITAGITFFAASIMFATVVGTLYINIVGDAAMGNNFMDMLTWLGGNLPAYYVFSRLSLMLPAVATDQNIRLSDAWALGRNNGLKLMLVVCILPWALSSFLGIAWREDPSAFEIGLLTLLSCVTFIIEISALSLAYRELTRAG